jgi:hypothetical protein
MGKNVVPTLSPAGFVDNIIDKADFLFAHVFESDRSQSYIYPNGVMSVAWFIQEYGHDISTLTMQLRLGLEAYFSSYFDAVAINVISDANETNLTNSVNLTISAHVVDDGVDYSLANLVEITNSKVNKVIRINNYGG